jgi:hypothetical protein
MYENAVKILGDKVMLHTMPTNESYCFRKQNLHKNIYIYIYSPLSVEHRNYRHMKLTTFQVAHEHIHKLE